MIFKKICHQFIFLIFTFAVTVNFAAAQKAVEPRQEKLLNGLKLLMWKEPSATQTTIRLRVHSGAAFDPQNKEGVMKLLAASFFPNESAREFFAEELNGSLDVTANYDYIQVTASGDSQAVLQMLETIAAAVTNPTLDKETTAKVKAAQLEKITAMATDAKYIADRAAAERLFGTFPYGRAENGTPESLARIDFADLLLAEQRFLTADNATLAISGNIDYDLVYRAARRFFGAWHKSEKLVPANFTQPDAPDEKPFHVSGDYKLENSQVRYATRGLAHGDKDFYAAEILTSILQNRLANTAPKDYASDISVKQSGFLLPGYIIFGYTSTPVPVAAAPVTPTPGRTENIVTLISRGDISEAEFTTAKSDFLKNYNQTKIYERWLDADTYKFSSVKDDANRAVSVALADVNRVLKQLRMQPIVRVSVMKKTAAQPEEKSDR